jgi:NADPH:quinone reductase-like Zn-dependent oxidoreductase
MAASEAQIKAIIHYPRDHSLQLLSQPDPIPSGSQYLIAVHAVGITKGELQWPEPCSLPTPIPGFDVAGTVLAAPSPQSRFQPGDRVYALTAFDRPANAREKTVIEENELAKIPDELSFNEAAAVPMSALTAKEALFDKGGLAFEENSSSNKEHSLLIIGASGAVGIWAMQFARWAGVRRIVAVCGSSNVNLVRSLGATDTIDHQKTSLKEWAVGRDEGSKFDLVLDGVGGQSLSGAWTAVKKDGRLISIVQPVDDLKPQDGVGEGVKGSFFIVQPSGQQLAIVTDLLKQKLLKPVVDGVYSLNDFQKAFDRVESGRARGKVILEIS